MTTPIADMKLNSVTFIRKAGTGYDVEGFMTNLKTGLDYFYLPAGQSTISITATEMMSAFIQVDVWSAGGGTIIKPYAQVVNPTESLGIFKISSKGEGSATGRWLKIKARNVYSRSVDNGTVGVEIITMPPT